MNDREELDEKHVLLPLSTASEGSQLLSLARTLSRVEALSHALVGAGQGKLGAAARGAPSEHTWSSGDDAPFELVPEIVELPRLKLTLVSCTEGDCSRPRSRRRSTCCCCGWTRTARRC